MITYYLEEICIQVKAGQIERACVYDIVKKYTEEKDVES